MMLIQEKKHIYISDLTYYPSAPYGGAGVRKQLKVAHINTNMHRYMISRTG